VPAKTTESVSIEWLVGSVRKHPLGGSFEDRSAYDAVATVVRLPDGTAHIRACAGTLTRETVRLLREELAKFGFTSIQWERHKPHGSRQVDLKAT
jgi:hypothetical protein